MVSVYPVELQAATRITTATTPRHGVPGTVYGFERSRQLCPTRALYSYVFQSLFASRDPPSKATSSVDDPETVPSAKHEAVCKHGRGGSSAASVGVWEDGRAKRPGKVSETSKQSYCF
jgi:hypothetical protein